MCGRRAIGDEVTCVLHLPHLDRQASISIIHSGCLAVCRHGLLLQKKIGDEVLKPLEETPTSRKHFRWSLGRTLLLKLVTAAGDSGKPGEYRDIGKSSDMKC